MGFQKALRLATVTAVLCGLSIMGYAESGVNASPSALSFGNCTVGASCATETVTVTNSGRGSVKIESATLSSLQFAYSGPTLPLTLAPGQSFSGSVLFLPTAAQTYSGELTFERANRQLISVALSGTGLALRSVPVTPTITWTAPAAITYGTALSAAQLDASASTAGSFSYSPALGTVLTAGSHSLSVMFTPSNAAAYNTATGSVALTVNKVTPTITWATPAAVTSGTALSATQLDASSSVSGSFAYSPALGTVLKAGSQSLSVTFTPNDATDYNTATGSVALTVNQMTTTITWATPAPINYGTDLSATQLDATANVAGSFAYSPALGTVLTAGSQTLSVTFTPSNGNGASTGSVVLTVNKVTPMITWAAPAAINSGTALSATQLDASANVAGSLAYAPALGTVLSSGSQTLSVTFTPSDTTDYNKATGSASLTVNNAAPATGTLTVNPPSVSLGNVIVGANSSETVTVTNSGSGSVTISNVSISGPGVSASGVSSGVVLASGQTASLDVTFSASSTGNVTGGVTIVSNASDSSLTIPMSASGVSPAVSLSWSADSSATGGYDVYSSTVSGGPYNLVASTPAGTAAYSDNTVQAGLTYYYVVTAINMTTNVQSSYSNQATVVIP
jgi:hypothetical protein